MTTDQTGLGRHGAQRTQNATRPVLLAVAALLALTWTGAWLFKFGEASVLAASLTIFALGLMAVGVRTGIGGRNRATTPPGQVTTLASELHGQSDQSFGNPPNEHLAAPVNGRRWSLDVFAAIDAQRFAAVCETWFLWAGFETRCESHRTDEGVDIWLHAAKMPGPVAIVRCKHWLHKPVGLQEMKEFMGVMSAFKSAHGTYTTTSTYTPEALQFAREHGIDAVDGRSLLRRIQTRTRQHQQALLAVAYNGQG